MRYLLFFLLFAACDVQVKQPSWLLVWEENFDGSNIDSTRWSKISRGASDWNNYMSLYEPLFAVKDGQLILRGIVNDVLPADTAPYLTGGVFTVNKVGFGNGRLEIRAKLGKAKGAWPAFWLLPFDNTGWPYGGEIDIMERLNGEDKAYQTVHSEYTVKMGIKEPKQGATGKIDPDDYNVYAVEMYPDSLSFFINDIHTFSYPRLAADSLSKINASVASDVQFPFNREYYLLLDMQLGGSWVGAVEPDDLPMEMWIDWVRFYKLK